jgi:hypothetical protein
VYSARGILYVIRAPRDKVYVAMEDRLPCSRTIVHAYVELVHTRVNVLNSPLPSFEEPGAGIELRSPKLKVP